MTLTLDNKDKATKIYNIELCIFILYTLTCSESFAILKRAIRTIKNICVLNFTIALFIGITDGQ